MQLLALFSVLSAVAAAPVVERQAAASGSSAAAMSEAPTTTFVEAPAASVVLPVSDLRMPFADFDFQPIKQISLGPRPYYLVDDMSPSPLKDKLVACKEKRMHATSWSIGHRGGGTMQFPEHTVQSNLAGARMGAGVLECDVSYTKDLQLVCRHSQCDLHTTTNVVTIPELNAKCQKPFVPANGTTPASAQCCTSDFTLEELYSLCAKMDSSDPKATTPEQFLGGILPWRTSLYQQCGTIMSHRDHIAMTDALGLEFTPELKTPEVPMPEGYTQEKYAQQLVDDYRAAGVDLKRVWPQSFLYDDILYWLKADPEFGAQAMYLDGNGDNGQLPNATAALAKYAKDGVKYISPPSSYLLTAVNGTLEASDYAKEAKRLGLSVITWSLERSGPLAQVKGDYYFENFDGAVKRDGDLFVVIDALHKAGAVKAFSDWSGTATYYANCMGLK